MRVTRIIKDYVEKTVEARMPYGEPSTQYYAAREQLHTVLDELNERLRSIARELVKTANVEMPKGFELYALDNNLVSSSYVRSALYEAAAKHEAEVRRKRERVVNRILVELELGGSKEELERIISEAIAISE